MRTRKPGEKEGGFKCCSWFILLCPISTMVAPRPKADVLGGIQQRSLDVFGANFIFYFYKIHRFFGQAASHIDNVLRGLSPRVWGRPPLTVLAISSAS